MKKKNNSTKTLYIAELIARERDGVKDLIEWRRMNLKEEEIEFLAKVFWQWALLDSSLQLQCFYDSIGVCARTWEKLILRHELLADVHELVKDKIGQRREAKVWQKDATIMLKTMRLYNPDHRATYNEDRDNKLQLNKEGAKNIQLVMEAIPSRDEVPTKKDKA